jgi:hypothetical protein
MRCLIGWLRWGGRGGRICEGLVGGGSKVWVLRAGCPLLVLQGEGLIFDLGDGHAVEKFAH